MASTEMDWCGPHWNDTAGMADWATVARRGWTRYGPTRIGVAGMDRQGMDTQGMEGADAQERRVEVGQARRGLVGCGMAR